MKRCQLLRFLLDSGALRKGVIYKGSEWGLDKTWASWSLKKELGYHRKSG